MEDKIDNMSEYLNEREERQYMHKNLSYQLGDAVRTETRGGPLSQQREVWENK